MVNPPIIISTAPPVGPKALMPNTAPSGLGEGETAGEGEGEGLALGEGDGETDGEGEGLGEADGLADGEGLGVAEGAAGAATTHSAFLSVRIKSLSCP